MGADKLELFIFILGYGIHIGMVLLKIFNSICRITYRKEKIDSIIQR